MENLQRLKGWFAPQGKQNRSFSAASVLAVTLLALSLQACQAQTEVVQAEAPARVLPPYKGKVAHVIHISVDALGAKYLTEFLQKEPQNFDSFGRLIREGATTLNARTDYDYTVTLPNHTCMVTGRPVHTPAEWAECKGHYWEWNSEFPSDKAPASLHATNPDKGYTASTFDVAHDAGLSTALYSGKTKFKVFTYSYGSELGSDNPHGRNKIDYSIIGSGIHDKAFADLKLHKAAYTFLHYPEPDAAGHAYGYLGPEYHDSVVAVNGYLKDLMTLVDTDPEWKGRTVIVLSADHGGRPGTKNHGDADQPHNYTIPFMVWGVGVAKGADLYKLNPASRLNPGDGRPAYAPTGQPIRNGDGGNLSLSLLGLPAIPGSHINSKQDLKVE
ncbi:hypothetical protein EON83_26500 [bacterium]|nr:MAG: hypothetical protein EON83_26500 [bacterium]